jgi:hypothetical protein
MEWKTPAEHAAVGFFGYGALSLALSPSLAHFSLASLAGALAGACHAYLRPLPWKNYLKRLDPRALASEKKSACVSVSRGLHFREVSTKTPQGSGYIRIQGLDKRELYDRLKDKAINRDTIPFHMRVLLEEGRQIDVPWNAIEPYLRAA